MRRVWGVVIGVAVVTSVIAAAVGYAVGGRSRVAQPDAPADPAQDRLRVAAWLQDWPAVVSGTSIQLYVSPNGDGSSCTVERRCVLATAQERVRQMTSSMTSDIVVSLAGGDYKLDSPLVLTAQDSGRNGRRVIYRAAPGETPVLSGGQRVAGWRAAEGRPGVFVADVPGGSSSRQLYVNNGRATRARGPSNPPGWIKSDQGFRAPDERMAGWRNPTDVEIVSFAEWRAFRCRVAAARGAALTMAQPCWRNATAPTRFGMSDVTWVENALELLDEPGEWYLDRGASAIYYRPRAGEDMSVVRTTLAQRQSLIELRGTATEPVHDLGIEGLTFSYSGWDGPSSDAGYAATQAGWHRGQDAGPDPLDIERTPGAVRVTYARHVRFERNSFTHLGGVGLDVAAGAQDTGIIGNRFNDVSSTALQIGEGRQGAQNPPPSDQLDRLQVADNLIENVAVEYADGVGIFASYVSNASLMHNELNHLPYSGISLGWGWGTDSYARNNVVFANRITNVMTTLQDGGAIYTLSPMPGTVIERNHIADQHNRSGALFLDEGTAFVTVADNVVERTPRWLHIWTGSIHDNTIVDNFSDSNAMVNDGIRNSVARNQTDRAAWPAAARQIIDEAGLEPSYADLRDHP